MSTPLIIACDFDESIAYTEKDGIPRELLPYASEVLVWIRNQGHFLILWTCRTGERLAVALRFLHGKGIVFDAVNENWPNAAPTSRKIFSHFYIDDHSFPIDWLEIKKKIAAMPPPEDVNPDLYQDAIPEMVKHQLSVHGNRLKKKLGKPPRWIYPLPVEIAYRKLLLSFVERLKAEVEKSVLPKISMMISEAKSLKQDSWSSDLTDSIDNLPDVFPESQMIDALEAIAFKANTFNAAQWYKICKKVFGIQVYVKESELSSRMETFVHDNVTLVKDVGNQIKKDLRLIISEGIRNGDRYETISKNILADTDLTRGTIGKAKTRSKIIARDQIGKLNGDISQIRQQGVGVDIYRWESAEDERVVGTPGGKWPKPSEGHGNHYFMNQKLCKWSNLDIYSDDGGKTWKQRPANLKGAIPGSQFLCRCFGAPVFPKEFGIS